MAAEAATPRWFQAAVFPHIRRNFKRGSASSESLQRKGSIWPQEMSLMGCEHRACTPQTPCCRRPLRSSQAISSIVFCNKIIWFVFQRRFIETATFTE